MLFFSSFTTSKSNHDKKKKSEKLSKSDKKPSLIQINISEDENNPSEELKRDNSLPRPHSPSQNSKGSWSTGSATSALSDSSKSSGESSNNSRPQQISVRKSLFFEAVSNNVNRGSDSPGLVIPNIVIPNDDNRLSLSMESIQMESQNKFQLSAFLRDKILCTQGNALRYADMLCKHGIPSLDVLERRLQRDPELLLNIGFEEYDAQEIRDYLETNQNTNHNRASMSRLIHLDSNLSAISAESGAFSSYPGSPMSRLTSPRVAEGVLLNAAEVAKLYYDASQCSIFVALEQLKLQAADGNQLAQGFLMRMHAIGQGSVKKDLNKAQALADTVYPYLCELATDKTVDKTTLMYARYLIGCCISEGLNTKQSHADAVVWYRLSADHGYAAAQAYLGTCFYDGLGVEQDYTEAVKWYKLSAEQGFASAQCNLGLCYEQGHGVLQNNIEAVRWYRLGANQGHGASRYNLGYCYEKGIGVTKNFEEAICLYIESAEKEYAPAQYVLGNFFATGRESLPQDLQKSFQYYYRGAENGHPAAQYKLALCYEQGIGIPANVDEALLWYRRSAREGHVPSKIKVVLLTSAISGERSGLSSPESSTTSDQFEKMLQHLSSSDHICASPTDSNSSATSAITPRSYGSQRSMDDEDLEMMPTPKAILELGICYEQGKGIEPDYQMALQWYTVSAIEGEHAEAQFRLGLYHELGTNGAEKDIIQALQWYRQAATNNHPIAAYKIGICYEKGHANIEKNENFAITFYKQSAELGYAPAQHQLGLCHFNGIGGLKKATKEAVHWYQLAAEQGYPPAINSLGFCYFHGHHLNKNLKLAIKLYKLAADSGYVVALNNLGHCYLQGLGVQKNDVMAFRLFKIAAKLGYAPAQNNVGNCYFDGIGVMRNPQLAFGWYKLAAEQSHTTAQYNLGYCFEKGYGCEKVSLKEAIKYYHLAAIKGNRKAIIAIRKFPKNLANYNKEAASSNSNLATVSQ